MQTNPKTRPILKTIPRISPELLASVNHFLVRAPFGSKTVFESKVTATVRASFAEKIKHVYEDEKTVMPQFRAAWVSYLSDPRFAQVVSQRWMIFFYRSLF